MNQSNRSINNICFVCGQHCMNTSYYPISIAIKPKGEHKRKKDTGLIFCEICYECTPMGSMSLDPWNDYKDRIIKELSHYRAIWKKLKNLFQNTKQYDLFKLMQKMEKDKP